MDTNSPMWDDILESIRCDRKPIITGHVGELVGVVKDTSTIFLGKGALMIQKFRKKPVVIEAMQFTEEAAANYKAIEAWCGGSVKGIALPPSERIIHIQTLEGEMTGQINDWIIKGVKGEFYPCKPDIFQATYEPE